jgi:ribonucleotide monophosphatase NagD (HAD superfamily)
VYGTARPGDRREAQSLDGRAVLRRLGLAANATAMVGDRLATDIGLASTAGMTGVLVFGGATRREDIGRGGPQPHHVIDTLSDLLPSGVAALDSRGR